MKLTKLGLIALVLAPMAAPMAAVAQIQTYYRAGVWDAFSGRTDRGGAVCGVGNTNPADNRRLSIRFEIGGANTLFSVSKPDWAIPDNTRVAVVMQIGLNTPSTEQGIGHGHSIDWSVDPNAIQPFDPQFRGSSSMTLTFPDGNEPPWTLMLTGSSAISDAFRRCVRDLTRQVQAAGGIAPAPQAAPSEATQPFSPPPGAPPADGSNSYQPTATQPGPTQPTGTQPTR
jgi:hypothetical protein